MPRSCARMSAGVGASGFSQITSLPASSAAMTSSVWYMLGVQTSMISMSGSLIISAALVDSFATPYCSPHDLENWGNDIAARYDFGEFRGRPTGHMSLGNAADTDDADFENV